MRRQPTRPARRGWPLPRGCAARAIALLLLTARAVCAAAAEPAFEPEVAGVVLNAVLVSEGELIYVDPAARRTGFWVKTSSLLAWRLMPDEPIEREFESSAYQLVCGRGGPLTCFHDDSGAIVSITAPASRVAALSIGALALPRVSPTDAQALGAYANYDLFASVGMGALKGGYVDSRLFAGQGTGYLRAAVLEAGGQRILASRIMGWEWDLPERTATLTLGGFFGGDTVQRAPVPMMGVRYGSNFSLRPEIPLSPLPWVRGEVERPSRADLFVDGLFRRSGEVPYGPFRMQADSLLAGLGELQTVLTDQRGVQTVQTQHYYFAPQLLPEGIDDFSVEAGSLSPDPARLSLSNQPVISAGLRRGWSSLQTLSVTAVVTRSTAMVGGVSDLQLREFGVLRSGLSWLRRGDTQRARVLLGYEYQSRLFSVLARCETTPRDRSTTTIDPAIPAPALAVLPSDRHSAALAASMTLSDQHQVAASVFDRVGFRGEHSQSVVVGATYRPTAGVQLSLGVQRASFPKPANFVVLSLLIPLDARHLGVVSSTRANSRTALQWSVQSRPDDSGDGSDRQYRAFGQIGPSANVGASYQRNESAGQWAVEAQTQGNRTRGGARVSGAVGWLENHPFATQRIDDSFIVVDSDGQPDVPVFYENRYAGKTNAQGKLLIPGARSYQPNQVSVDSSALPIEYTLARDQIGVVPRSHAGAPARFEIGDGGIMLPVVQADGRAVPAGAQATISTQSRAAAVSSRSEVFIARAARAARVTVQWPGGACGFDYLPESAGAPGADTGTLQCR